MASTPSTNQLELDLCPAVFPHFLFHTSLFKRNTENVSKELQELNQWRNDIHIYVHIYFKIIYAKTKQKPFTHLRTFIQDRNWHMCSRKGLIVNISGSFETIQLCHYRAKAAIGNISMECLCFNKVISTETKGGPDLIK